MDIGNLDKRCELQRPTVTKDAYGGAVTTWATFAQVWCNAQDVLPSRDEQVRSGITATTVKSRLRMRYRSDVDTTCRIRFMRPTEQFWNIIGGVAEVGVRDGIEIMIEKTTIPNG